MALPNSDCEGKLLASILTEKRTTPELWRSSGHFVFLKRLVEFEALGLLHLTFRRFFVRPLDPRNGLLQEAFKRNEKVVIISLD